MKNDATEDLKVLRNYVLGVVAFSTAITTFLVQALHFPLEQTLISAIAFSCFMLLIGFLINRAEKRQRSLLQVHLKESTKFTNNFNNQLTDISATLLEIRCSSMRLELMDEIRFSPHNHDTILKIAEKYFGSKESGGLEGDWYLSSEFSKWAKKEDIVLPPTLQSLKEK